MSENGGAKIDHSAAARRFGLARETVRKMLRYRLPPEYRRAKPIRCPKLDAFTGVIGQILTDDQQRPKKQRHTVYRTRFLGHKFGLRGLA